jgi:outer membrane protein, multidrug efflux system
MKRSWSNIEGWRIQMIGRLTLVVVCALAAALSGCALTRPPTPAELVAKALPQGTTIPTAWSSNPEMNGEVTNDWLKSFNDPGLDAVVAEAIRNNLNLRQAASQVEVAQQNVVVIGAKLKPQVNAVAGASVTRDPAESKRFDSSTEYGLVFWEIDLWGRLRAQRAAAEESFQATAMDYAFARQSLAALTAKSWYLTIETRQLLALAEQSVAVYADLLDLVKVRRAAGKVADLDVAEASANLNEAQSQLRLAESLYGEARRNLEVLVGRYPAAELEVSETFAPLPPPVPAGLPSSLLARRPDLVSAERQVLAAFRTQEAATLALLQDISLTLEGGRLSNRTLSLLLLNPWLFHSALGMTVPIYQGGALLAQTQIATAEQEQAVAHYGSVALTAFREVESALMNEDLFAQSVLYDEKALKQRTEAVQIARLKYVVGSMDMLSVLQLQEVQLASQATLIKRRESLLANRINLHLALGGSFDAAPVTSYGALEKRLEERRSPLDQALTTLSD